MKPLDIALWLWCLWGFLWAVLALRTQSTVKAEASVSRLFHVSLLVASFFLMYKQFSGGVLGSVLFTPSLAVSILGLVLVGKGIIFSCWARFHLGKYWSGRITLKQDHKLIQSGPYRWVRHPIYTGILLAMLGTALMIGKVHAFAAVLIMFVAYCYKISREEKLLSQQFGSDYEAYRQRTKALLPLIW